MRAWEEGGQYKWAKLGNSKKLLMEKIGNQVVDKKNLHCSMTSDVI